MGLYSNNRTSLSDVEIPALEGYNGNVGIATAMLEATREDLKFFDMIIVRDFQEAEMNLSGSVNESEMVSITEGVLGDAWKRILEFLKKMLAKVKAIFDAAMAKINGVLIRDNKKLVDKYNKVITNKDLKNMKYKWAEVNHETIVVSKLEEKHLGFLTGIENCDSAEAVSKWLEENEEKFIPTFYKAIIDVEAENDAEFMEKAHEYLWKETEELEEGAEGKKTDVKHFLTNAAKELSEMKSTQSKLEATIKKLISAAERKQREALDKATKDDTAKVELAKANATQKVHAAYQTAVLAVHKANLAGLKFKISMYRAFWTKAAAYNPKAKNESVELFDAIDEAVEFDVESTFADYTVA